ncbi:phenolic acid decarboxylase [Citrobacter sp. Cb004]|uniref:phenolic acid decarboxylase n=1 Tax=Citrobacter sp. Cb004 TaxID=2985006 RepID=UPI002578D436|nr:phenolic acid decarboxylase [Citrobacter sp. Cb004]MDM3357003.1 phenolic acid decarboxylase [Citrobacter sp. Cb004]
MAGKHLVYTYDNGWDYELYVKNSNTIDYRIHSGMVGNRWVKDQFVYISRIGENIYKITWAEPTGTNVCLTVNFDDNLLHGTIYFPRWVMCNPEKTICFQNNHIHEMETYRDIGPIYPIEIIDEFATITFVQECGINNENIICCAASELPENFPECLKQIQ